MVHRQLELILTYPRSVTLVSGTTHDNDHSSEGKGDPL